MTSSRRLSVFLSSLSFRVVVGLVAGLVVGALAHGSGSPLALGAVGVVEQLGQVWLNALRITVIPLVFGLLVTGIVSIADAAATGRLAVRALVVFGVMLTGAVIYGILAIVLAFSVRAAVVRRTRQDV